jgi:hypothetical protein
MIVLKYITLIFFLLTLFATCTMMEVIVNRVSGKCKSWREAYQKSELSE